MQKNLVWLEVKIYSVKAKNQAGNKGQRYNDNTKWPKLRENQLGILKTYALCLKIQQSASGPGGVLLELLSIYENTLKKLPHLPPKSCCNFTYLVVHGSMQSEHCSHIVKVGVEATS